MRGDWNIALYIWPAFQRSVVSSAKRTNISKKNYTTHLSYSVDPLLPFIFSRTPHVRKITLNASDPWVELRIHQSGYGRHLWGVEYML